MFCSHRIMNIDQWKYSIRFVKSWGRETQIIRWLWMKRHWLESLLHFVKTTRYTEYITDWPIDYNCIFNIKIDIAERFRSMEKSHTRSQLIVWMCYIFHWKNIIVCSRWSRQYWRKTNIKWYTKSWFIWISIRKNVLVWGLSVTKHAGSE